MELYRNGMTVLTGPCLNQLLAALGLAVFTGSIGAADLVNQQPNLPYLTPSNRIALAATTSGADLSGETNRTTYPSATELKTQGMIHFTAGKLDEAKREFEAASKLEPNSVENWVWLARIFCAQGQSQPAIEALHTVIRLEPAGNYAVWAHTQLGCCFAAQGSRNLAASDFRDSARLASTEDATAFKNLWFACANLNEVTMAVEFGEKFVALSKAQNVDRADVEGVEKYLSVYRPTLTAHFITNEPPISFTGQSLRESLQKKLAADELKLVVNPLEGSQEIDRWADKLVAGGTNDLQKARMLFDAMVSRVDRNGMNQSAHHFTAKEVYADWNKPEVLIQCEQAACLYVALARAAGLKAFFVSVEESCTDGKSPHACAAVYFPEGALLIDVSYSWFGVPHKRFILLNDLQAIAIYLSHLHTLPTPIQNEVAAKLAPDLGIVQANLASELIDFERWEEARKLVPVIVALDFNGVMANTTQARLAIHDGKYDEAISFLTRATEANPEDAIPRRLMGVAYEAQGKLELARAAFQEALRCPHTESQARSITNGLIEIARRLPETR